MKVLHHSVYIKATPQKIWETLIAVEKWAEWDKDIKSAKLSGDFVVGATGTLIDHRNKCSVFYITEVDETKSFSNYYQYQFFTDLKFKHEIEQLKDKCKVTFTAYFAGPFSWFFNLKLKSIHQVMENAMKNLIYVCETEPQYL